MADVSENPSGGENQNEGENKGDKTTLFYRKFNKKEHQQEREDLQNKEGVDKKKDKEVQIKLERELENEALKQRFFDLAERVEKGALRAEVDVSGEKHSISFNKLFEKGKEEKMKDTVKKVKDGKTGLDDIAAGFKLSWTYGRKETLYLDLKTPIKTLLRGGGEVEKQLKKLITEQFAGTSDRYKKLQDESDQNKKKLEIEPGKGPPVEDFKKTLEKGGAELTEMKGEKIYSVTANFPQENKQISLSTNDGQTWNVVVVKENRMVKDLANLRPEEVMPIIETEK